jgi:hypothetical protein
MQCQGKAALAFCVFQNQFLHGILLMEPKVHSQEGGQQAIAGGESYIEA